MGVTGLAQLILDVAPEVMNSESQLSDYAGKKIAMDASQYLYQSLSPRNIKGDKYGTKVDKTDNASPLIRTFFNCITLLENNIKPLFVFDGQAPKIKAVKLKERTEQREVAKIEYKEAVKKNDVKKMEKLQPKTVKVTPKQVKNCRGLLKVMGIPFFHAPGEAEAQCASFVEKGRVFAAATHDMDALTYGTKVVLRHLPLHSSKYPMQEIRLDKVLASLGLTLPEFIDLSIILGCDYCGGVAGLSPHRAIELLHMHGNIENIIDRIDPKRFSAPKDWLFREARELFQAPKIVADQQVKEFQWRTPDEEKIVDYLNGEQQFDEQLIRGLIKSALRHF